MKLTRYLYHLCDVKYSFITSLLKGDDMKEVLFWASELYYSGYTEILYDLIWKLYYDFYAITNPLLEKKINKLNNQLNNQLIASFNNLSLKSKNECKNECKKNIKLQINTHQNEKTKDLIWILNYMFDVECIDYHVFEFRCLTSIPLKISKKCQKEQRGQKWFLDIKEELYKEKIFLDKIEENLLISIHNENENENSIKYYIERVDTRRCYKILRRYYKIIKDFKIKMDDDYLNTIVYDNKRHILMALICYFDLELCEIENKRLKSKKYGDDYYNYFVKTNNIINISPCKILKEKRDYGINKNIGCFIENLNDLNKKKQQIFWNNWEYFANFSPIWKKRFEKYNCIFENKTPTFKNDNMLEDFYEIYGYEPDEQNKETQMKSTLQIENNSIKEWIIHIFDEESVNVDIKLKKIVNY